MWKSLRLKIFGSFLLLILMLALAGGISIYQLNWLSQSVHGLIEDNYKSIKATKTMMEALEREDSGILLFLLVEPEEGEKILTEADKKFQQAFQVAKNNKTEKNESQYIEAVRQSYRQFKDSWQYLDQPQQTPRDISWYKNTIHNDFKEAKKDVEALMMLNQESMYGESSAIKDKARRAIMPGIISVIAAIIFSLILNFYITRHFVAPISRITDAVNDTCYGDSKLDTTVRTKGEIKKLEVAINKMIQRLNRKNR